MNILDMVRRQLVALGADGLANPGQDCGCGLDDLAPCGNPHETECVSARKVERGGDGCTGEDCDWWVTCGQVGEGCHLPMEADYGA